MLNEDLEQRELFNKFYKITDQAIDKAVSFQDIDGLSASQNWLIRDCIKRTLITAKKENNCNEVAVACNSTRFGTEYGDTHGVDIDFNINMKAIINDEKNFCVLFHNHPSTQTFSLQDLDYFLRHKQINVFGIVSNLGNVELLFRRHYTVGEDFKETEKKLNIGYNKAIAECTSLTDKNLYSIAKKALKKFKQYGYYIKL